MTRGTLGIVSAVNQVADIDIGKLYLTSGVERCRTPIKRFMIQVTIDD